MKKMMKNASPSLSLILVFVGLTDGVACRHEKCSEKKAVGSRRSEYPSHASAPLDDNTKRGEGGRKRRKESVMGEAEKAAVCFCSCARVPR